MTQAITQSNLNELLADCGTIDAVSWQAPRNMTYAQWSEIGSKFQFVNGSLNWWLGDWLNEGEKRYGDTYTQAIELTGNSLENLKKYKSIATNVTKLLRSNILSWTHHYHVAKLDSEAQDRLLRFAEQHNLSSRELLDAVREYEAEVYKASRITAGSITNEYDQDDLDSFAFAANAEKRYTIIDEAGVEETVIVKPGEELMVVSVDPPSATAYDEPTSKPHVSQNSGNNEWYTPPAFIDAARAVMGDIDLDPASSTVANETVKAKDYFTKDDDGLSLPWYGRVWMNPPYAADLIAKFTEKLAGHVAAGDVQEAIVLVNNATETGWFQDLIGVASAVAFPQSRVKFYQPDGKLGAPLQGQAIIYMGNQPDLFRETFSTFGWSAKL
jgi:hypothetical protein